MWSTATLSQPKLNVQLPTVREDSELEDFSVSGKTRWSYDQKAGHDAEGDWEASDGVEDKDRFKPEEPELGGDSSQGSRLEEDASKTDNGQCGLTGLWAPTGQGAGQSLNVYRGKMGENSRTQVSRIPWKGRPR